MFVIELALEFVLDGLNWLRKKMFGKSKDDPSGSPTS